jgi:hypothetical protein
MEARLSLTWVGRYWYFIPSGITAQIRCLLLLEDGNLYLCLRTMSHTIYAAKFEQTITHQHELL